MYTIRMFPLGMMKNTNFAKNTKRNYGQSTKGN